MTGRSAPSTKATVLKYGRPATIWPARGFWILALAYRDDLKDSSDWSVDHAEQKLIFIGFTASSDPVRPGVPEAIDSCHRAAFA